MNLLFIREISLKIDLDLSNLSLFLFLLFLDELDTFDRLSFLDWKPIMQPINVHWSDLGLWSLSICCEREWSYLNSRPTFGHLLLE